MAVRRDLYETLGLANGAGPEEVERAYRKLAVKFHPDRNFGDPEAAEKLKEINQAYDVLKDPSKKELYDSYGFEGLERGGPDFGRGAGGFADIVNDFMEAFMGNGRGRGPHPGRDLQLRLDITLEEAYRGARKPVTFAREESCPDCEGRGSKRGSKPAACRHCGGRGRRLLRQS